MVCKLQAPPNLDLPLRPEKDLDFILKQQFLLELVSGR